MLYEVMVGMSRNERNGKPMNALAVWCKALYVLVNGDVTVSNMLRATEGGGGHAITLGR